MIFLLLRKRLYLSVSHRSKIYYSLYLCCPCFLSHLYFCLLPENYEGCYPKKVKMAIVNTSNSSRQFSAFIKFNIMITSKAYIYHLSWVYWTQILKNKRLALLYYNHLNNKTSFYSSTNHFPFITYGYKSRNKNI